MADAFYRPLVQTFRKNGVLQEDWHMNCSGMRQTEEECYLIGLATEVAAVEGMRATERYTEWPPSPQQVDEYMRGRAAESPIAFVSYMWLKLRGVIYGIIDTKHDGAFGNHERYVQLLPVVLSVPTVCGATNYCPMLIAEIERWALASDNEKKIFAHGIYVMTSARGGSTTWFDETQEKVNGGIRKIVGKDYWEGKQKLIALAALRLADFQQCRRQNAHGFTCAPKETVTRAGARSIGAERNSTLSLSDAFWGPLRAWRDSKIWAVGDHIFIKGKPHQRGSLITLAGQPMNPKFLALLDVAEARQSALAQKVGLERTWRHEIGLRTVESDAGKDRESSAKEWCRAYSTSDTDIEKGWIVADLQAELGRLREEWPTRRGRDGSAIVAPTIPAVLGGAPGAKEWFGKALTHWTDAKLKKTTKKILVAMLAAARERLVTTGALVPPPRPQEAASASSACDPTVLRQQMDRHVMLQAMPSWEQIDERRGASGAGSSGRSALGKRRAETLASAVEQHD